MNKKQLTTTAVLTALVLGMTFSGAAQTLEGSNTLDTNDESQNQNSNIDVTVTSTTAIDVRPTSLSYPSMDVGTQEKIADGPQTENEFGSISLENIGSEYIDRVWVGSTSTTDDPFGTGLPGEYNAGNFLQVKPANSTSKASVRGNTSTYHYVNRYDFANSWNDNLSDIPSYIEASPSATRGSGTEASDTYVGRLRAGDEWYFYSIITGSSNDVCDGSANAVLRVGNTSHTTSQFGTVDFTLPENGGPRDWTEYEIASTDGSYGVTASTVQITLNDQDATEKYREYDILTSCDPEGAGLTETDPHTIRTRYNVQAGDVSDLTEAGGTGDTAGTRTQFLLDAVSADDMLFPGESLTVDTAVEVPQGVPEGGVTQGDLTFYVTSDYDSQR